MNNILKLQIVFASICLNLLCLNQAAEACFTGYLPENYLNNQGESISPTIFEKFNNKTMDYIKKQYSESNFQLQNTSLSGWSLFFVGFDQEFIKHSVAIYPLLNQENQGFVLLEENVYTEPCENEFAIQKELENQILIPSYLNIQVPDGFDLKFYEKRKGKYIYQTALFWYPTPIVESHNLEYEKASLTMRAKYHRDLEFILKPYIQSYFTYNIPKWIERYHQNLNS